MPRNTEASYRDIVDYLQQIKKPATINDMAEANILSKPTLYRLLRPEMFGEMAMYGLVPLNNKKPFFFAYNPKIMEKIARNADKSLADRANQASKVFESAAESITKNATILSPSEQQLIDRFRQHAENNTHVEWPRNFAQPPLSVEGYYSTLENVKAAVGEDKDKFRTLLVSMFVSSFNPEAEDV